MFLQTQADLASTSPDVAERVRQALKLNTTPSITVTPGNNSDILEFTSKAASPQLSARIATSYARQFRNFQRQLANAGATQKAGAFLVRPAAFGTKVQPRTSRNLAVGLLFGLLLGCALAFLREALDTRVRSTDEVAERLGLTLLARLPRPSPDLRRDNRLVMVSDPDGLDAEGFKILRANVDFARTETGATTLLVTSALEGEGKSTTVANLAVALARAGQRVVLVDLDLRRPYIQLLQPQGTGVAQVATGSATLEEALAPIPLVWPGARSLNGLQNGRQPAGGMLEVLPAGPMPARLDDVLAKNILGGILDALRQRADLVLIDATPLLAGDAMATSAAVDAILVVVRMSLVRRPVLRELRRVLDSVPYRKIGFVAAGVDSGAHYPGYVMPRRKPTRRPEPVTSDRA